MKDIIDPGDAGKNVQDTFIFWKTGFVGVALILSGVFFLLINFQVIPVSGEIHNRVLSILFFIIGIVFAFFQGAGRGLFWLIIPAGVAFTIGIITVIDGIDNLFSVFALSIFCLGLAVTFLLVFLLRKTEWWALLPAGALTGISAWIFLSSIQPVIGFHPVALIFFVGTAFVAIYFFSVQKKKMRFALITGLIIVGSAIIYYFIVVFNEYVLLWPILLVALGILFPFAFNIIEKKIRKKHEYFPDDQH